MNFIKKKSWFHLNPHHVTKRADFTTKQQTRAFPTWTYSTNCISELEYGERCELRGSLTCLVRPLLSRPTMSQNNVRLLSACFRSTQPVLNSLTSVLFITSRCLDNLGLLCKTDLSDYGPLWEVASKSWFLLLPPGNNTMTLFQISILMKFWALGTSKIWIYATFYV